MKRIFIATTSFARHSDKALELLRNNECDISMNQSGRKLRNNEIGKHINRCDGVIAGTEEYSKTILDKITNLKVISRLGVGVDNIDLDYTEQKNIKVYKTESNPALAVSELTLGFILDLLREVSLHNSLMKRGIWRKTIGSLFSGKTLGIIGLGNIGRELIKLTMGFDLNYLAHDLNEDKKLVERYCVKYCDLDELLVQSDIVSVHLNLTNDTKNMINYKRLRKMKPEAILINTSRSEVINEQDLIKALDNHIISGVGVDVFHQEPYTGPLLKYDNVICTPHTGAYAREIRIKMEIEAAENLIKGLTNE